METSMITGRDIHNAYYAIEPTAIAWDKLSLIAKERYDIMALELNKNLIADKRSISSVRCMICHQMVDVDAVVCHPCFEEAQKTEPLKDDN
jgi:hypothetical protein